MGVHEAHQVGQQVRTEPHVGVEQDDVPSAETRQVLVVGAPVADVLGVPRDVAERRIRELAARATSASRLALSTTNVSNGTPVWARSAAIRSGRHADESNKTMLTDTSGVAVVVTASPGRASDRSRSAAW